MHDFECETVMLLCDDEFVNVLLTFNLLILELLGRFLVNSADPGLCLLVKYTQFGVQIQVLDVSHIDFGI